MMIYDSPREAAPHAVSGAKSKAGKAEGKPPKEKSQSAVELLIKLKISNRSTFESISNYTYLFTGIISNHHT